MLLIVVLGCSGNAHVIGNLGERKVLVLNIALFPQIKCLLRTNFTNFVRKFADK